MDVEGPVMWRRAGRCANSACVEVGLQGEHVLVRDSKSPDRLFLSYTFDEWSSFVDGVKQGEFDLATLTL